MFAVQSNRPSKWALMVCLLLLASNIYAAGLPPLTHGMTALKKPVPAPALLLKDLDDEVVDIAALKGKVVVLNFWATWCPPCRREMGSLERLYLATVDKDVVVLAVNIGEDEDTVFSFMGTIEPSPSFPILLDLEGSSMEAWKVRGLPTTFVIDSNGFIVYRAVGGREFDHPELINDIMALHKKTGNGETRRP